LSEHKKNSPKNPKYVTLEQCSGTTAQFREELYTIKLALFGKDMRGGIVKDIQEIKSATSILKSVGLPIAVAVISSVITAFLLGKL